MIRLLNGCTASVILVLILQMRPHPMDFSYRPPGELVAGSGTGRLDNKEYLPGIRFPLEAAPAFANSQVWGPGGSQGGGGSQCDVANYRYPWHDNFCETRDHPMPLCPAGVGHQGQDIRPATCVKEHYWAVAAIDGTVTNVGAYSVYVTADDGSGIRVDYLHMANVIVQVGNKVVKGNRLGQVSDVYPGGTTIHLHFNIRQKDATLGFVFVPPYTSLVSAYQHMWTSSLHLPAHDISSKVDQK